MTATTPERPKTMFVTLGTHCDLFWMGTMTECLERGTEIQRHALDLMEQHPEYCYYIETTIFAEYHLRKYPEDRVRMARLIERGQLEIGACFVDRIEHSHHGESIIRHAIEGLRWLDETFGPGPRTATHPDLPGMTPQLPQIYAAAGIDCYLRARGFGAVYDWIAPDGSHILYCNLFGYGDKTLEQFEQVLRDPRLTQSFFVRGGYGDLRDCSDQVLGILEELRRRHPDVNWQMASPGRVLDQLRSQPLPRLGGEMPYGWGSISSAFVAIMRQSVALEHQLLTAEKLLALLRSRGLALPPAKPFEPTGPSRRWLSRHRLAGDIFGQPIAPGDELRQLWRFELVGQDHNYGGRHGAQSSWDREVMRDYALQETGSLIERSLQALGGESGGERVVVFNPVSWPRNDLLLIADDEPATLRALTADGTPLPSQPADGGLVVEISGSPPLALQTLRLERGPAVSPRPLRSNRLRGEHLEAEIDAAQGRITRLFDRATGRDLVEQGGEWGFGELVSYKDPGVDVRYGFTGEVERDAQEPYQLLRREEGSVLARLAVGGTFLQSRVEKEFTIYRNLRRLDLTLRLWWWGKPGEHLRLCFPFAPDRFRETWYGVPFYAMCWPKMLHGDGVTDDLTLSQGGENVDMLYPQDRRHFREVVGWLDVGYDDHGVTVGTRSTCWWINGAHIEASLLRTQFSCGDARLWCLNPGYHEWTFSLLPHCGDWRLGRAYRRGEEMLNPLCALRLSPGTGPSQEPCSAAGSEPFAVSPEHVVITTVKPADTTADAILVRVLECEGRPAEVDLRLPFPVKSAELVNLVERAEGPLFTTGSTVRLTLRPHQFQTVRVIPAQT